MDSGVPMGMPGTGDNHVVTYGFSTGNLTDFSLPKIDRLPREPIGPAVLPYAPLMLAIFSIAYTYMDKLLHDVLLPRIYGGLYHNQTESQRKGFVMHHSGLIATGLIILVGIVPTMAVLAGNNNFSDPIVAGSGITFGDYILVPAMAYCGMYVGEMFFLRDAPGSVPIIHHIAVLLVSLTTVGITGNVDKNPSATVSFYIIASWCVFDLVSDLPIHAGLILWRCVRNVKSARSLSKIMRFMALWRLAMTLSNLGVSVYLFHSAWYKLSTIWSVVVPVAGWIWLFAQIQSAHTLYLISQRVRHECRHAARGADGSSSSINEKSLVEEGGPPRSGMLFSDPAYAGLTLGTTLLSYSHASGRVLTRSHLDIIGVGLAIGLTMLLIRYFTQDPSGVPGLAARRLGVFASDAKEEGRRSVFTRDAKEDGREIAGPVTSQLTEAAATSAFMATLGKGAPGVAARNFNDQVEDVPENPEQLEEPSFPNMPPQDTVGQPAGDNGIFVRDSKKDNRFAPDARRSIFVRDTKANNRFEPDERRRDNGVFVRNAKEEGPDRRDNGVFVRNAKEEGPDRRNNSVFVRNAKEEGPDRRDDEVLTTSAVGNTDVATAAEIDPVPSAVNSADDPSNANGFSTGSTAQEEENKNESSSSGARRRRRHQQKRRANSGLDAKPNECVSGVAEKFHLSDEQVIAAARERIGDPNLSMSGLNALSDQLGCHIP
ncbi:hypothetical protein PGQ11_010799 [Apiospora arundinis]|uniref:TLC domain-containing protein n=1 Tax=Apiospora arundinis TaxID=335852 RepID=A0ABR2IAU6_9PEZI